MKRSEMVKEMTGIYRDIPAWASDQDKMEMLLSSIERLGMRHSEVLYNTVITKNYDLMFWEVEEGQDET